MNFLLFKEYQLIFLIKKNIILKYIDELTQ